MSTQEKLCFEFSQFGYKWAGVIQTIDFNAKTAIVNITSDCHSCWKKVTDASWERFEVTLYNLISSTEKVSSHSYNELMKMLKERY